MTATTTLYRPVGTAELALIEAANWKAFPPRLPEQPIFYPVTNENYARQIARDWNAGHNADRRGYVTRFGVPTDFLAAYDRKVVGGREHEEYWIPAEDMDLFNAALEGPIEVVATYYGGAFGLDETQWEFVHDLAGQAAYGCFCGPKLRAASRAFLDRQVAGQLPGEEDRATVLALLEFATTDPETPILTGRSLAHTLDTLKALEPAHA